MRIRLGDLANIRYDSFRMQCGWSCQQLGPFRAQVGTDTRHPRRKDGDGIMNGPFEDRAGTDTLYGQIRDTRGTLLGQGLDHIRSSPQSWSLACCHAAPIRQVQGHGHAVVWLIVYPR